MSKSCWLTMSTHTERDKQAIKSWFAPICNEMTVESAEVLCDKVTDREKKLKAIMVDKDGTRKIVTRTGGRNFTISIENAS